MTRWVFRRPVNKWEAWPQFDLDRKHFFGYSCFNSDLSVGDLEGNGENFVYDDSVRVVISVWSPERYLRDMLQNFLSAAVQLHFLSTRSRRFATAHSTTSRWEIVCIQRPTMRAECSSSRSQIIKLVRSIIGTATAAEQNDDNSSISFNLRTYNTGLEHKRNQRIHHTSSAVCAFELRDCR